METTCGGSGMNIYPFAGEIKMEKVIKDGQEVIEWEPVNITYHADGNVGIGTPPDASAPVMGEPVERLRVSMSNHKAVQEERNKLAAWMIERGYATGHGDSIEKLLEELEWQIEERIKNEREACAKACEILEAEDDSFYAEFSGAIDCAAAIRARGEK